MTSISLPPRTVHAEDTSRVAAATVLFDEGIKALDAGRLDEACTKLAKSQELAPSGGTLIVLGDCYRRVGRITSAWVAFREAAARASAAGKRDAETNALEQAARLEPRLPRMTVTGSSPPGLEVRRDGVLLAPAELGVDVPLDPGRHEVRASAPGSKPWSRSVHLVEGALVVVDVPALEPETQGSSPGAGSNETSPSERRLTSTFSWSPQRTAGVIVGGAGLAMTAVGMVFGLLAKNENDEAIEHCVGTVCKPRGLELTDDAKSDALVSTILVALGGAALASGAVLFFTAPKAHTAVQVGPTLTGSSAGASASLRW